METATSASYCGHNTHTHGQHKADKKHPDCCSSDEQESDDEHTVDSVS